MLVGFGFAVRQNALLDADQEDMLELQPLGGVQRRQLDGVDVRVLLVEHVDQRDGLRQFEQRLLLLLALSAQPVAELLDVAPFDLCRARLVLIVQPGLVAIAVSRSGITCAAGSRRRAPAGG
jgi:hypothetical protein